MSFVGKSSQYYSGFSPTLIPDCVLWLDALDSNTLTLSGSNVTAWRDKSGRGNNSTGIVSTPTLRANSINGYPAVFLSSNAVRGGISPTISSNQLHCFMVVTALSTSGPYPRFLGLDDGVNAEYNSATGIAAFGRNGGPNFTASRQNSAASVSAADNVPHIVTTYVISSNQYITVDGSTNFSSASSSTTANFAISKWNLGCETGGSVYWNPQAYVGEVLVFSNALSSNLRYQVEGYLATKWGLRPNIPAIHPFKTLSPFTRPFIPVDISGCYLWLDAADSSSFTLSGSNITQWRDKSPESLPLTLVGTPTLASNSVNFTGSQYFTNSAISLNMAAMTVFLVAYNIANASSPGGILSLVPIANGVDYNQANAITYNLWFGAGEFTTSFNYGTSGISPTSTISTNPLLFTHVQNGTSMNTFNLGTGLYSTTTNFTPGTTTGLSVAGRFQSGNGTASHLLTGNIKEIIIFKVALSTQQRQQVETYLANKWRLRGSMSAGHYARLAPALSTSFIPTSVESCAVWLDGADATSVAVTGTSVTQWRDKTGNGYHFTVPGGFTSPTYSPNAINGLNSLSFIGAGGENGKYNALVNSSVPVNGTAYSMFTVVRRNASAPSWTGANYILTSPTGSRLFYSTYSGGFLTTSTGNATVGFNGLDANVPNTTMTATTMSGMVVNGTVLTPYASGSTMTTKTGTTTAYSGISIGDATGGPSGQCWSGFICEILIYNIALTTPQRQQVEGYLANKWGTVASLPSGHPYKAFKP